MQTSRSSIPPSVHQHNIWSRSWLSLRRNLNFYRIHVLFFTFTPVIAAAIFYGSNGETYVPFTDALFVCVSSITVTGLSTIDLSGLTPWQQVILFVLMCMGSPVTVSWLIVYVRRYYFSKKFEHIIQSQLSPTQTYAISPRVSWFNRLVPWYHVNLKRSSRAPSSQQQVSESFMNGSRVRVDMIRRVEGAPRLVDPSGWVQSSPEESEAIKLADITSQKHRRTVSPTPLKGEERKHDGNDNDAPNLEHNPVLGSTAADSMPGTRHIRRSTSLDSRHGSGQGLSVQIPSEAAAQRDRPVSSNPLSSSSRDRERHFPHAQTIEFVSPDPEETHEYGNSRTFLRTRKVSRGSIREQAPHDSSVRRNNTVHEHLHSDKDWRRVPTRTSTMHSARESIRPKLRAQEEGFGGFPLPHVIAARLLRRFFPRLQRRLTRTITIPYTATVQSHRGGQTTVLGAKPVPYISFDAIIGRNSVFHALTRENLEELGGVEFRALNALLWIVGLYHIGMPIFAFVIIAPYISQPRWSDVFHPPQQHRFVAPEWYTLFQVISAYTNTGTSLVDQSMVPLQKAYPEVLILPFLILAGNTAFPVFLRFVIWLISKVVNQRSRIHETLHFLLDHPRRCFIYLFPSHQTWFLLTILFLLNFTDWFFFIVLDINNPAIDTVPLGTRFAIGLLQATAVRSAGFGTVVLSALAPAVKVLYVFMMYVSVYPIAMSVRSTNVYEERSLGVFEEQEDGDEEEEAYKLAGERSRTRIWGKYLAAHARKQLSFDMWWLALALFLVCIVEKTSLEDVSTASWFNIFSIVFELTSAYGTVGLSLGTPNANYSFAGALRPLSKLIICAVMLRGRHRGLPVAIDRAVLLPAEFQKEDEETGTTKSPEASGCEPNDKAPIKTGVDGERRSAREGETGGLDGMTIEHEEDWTHR